MGVRFEFTALQAILLQVSWSCADRWHFLSAVLVAEIVQHFHPKLVELHNYRYQRSCCV